MYLLKMFIAFFVCFTSFSETSQSSLLPISTIPYKAASKNIFSDSINSGSIVINFDEHTIESIVSSLKEINKREIYYSAIFERINPNSLSYIVDYLQNASDIIIFSQDLTLDDLDKLRRLPSLSKLELENCKITHEGAEIIASIKSLRELNLSGNFIGYKGIRALAQKPNLITLNLGRNNLSDDEMVPISKSESLYEVNLSGNNIGNRGAYILSKSMSIASLNLSDNNISDEGCLPLSNNEHLIEVDLSKNSIGDEGAINLAKNEHLYKINLSSNFVKDKGGLALTNKSFDIPFNLSSWSSRHSGELVPELFLWNNPISEETKSQIKQKRPYAVF